jgi:hypothetical protein
MLDKDIQRLNRRLATDLGTLHGHPWFQWVWAPDCTYLERQPNTEHERYTPRSWGDRLGKVWVLAEWGPPPVSREVWRRTFAGQFPYPEKGREIVHGETALPLGMKPDEAVTQFYIKRIREQASTTYAAHLAEINAGLDKQMLDTRKEFMAYADDWFPAYWSSKGGAHTPGSRGGHVSFGGST